MVCLASLVTVFSMPSYSQFLPNLQAKTPAEFDAYLDVLEGPAIEKGDAFLSAFPQSALLLPVCEMQVKAWRAKGDAQRAITAADRGLSIAPEYVPLLVEIASVLANESQQLDRAESSANQALDLLERVKAPVRIPPDTWTAAVASLRAKARVSLGLVKFKRNDIPGAVKEFEAAIAAPGPGDATVHYRLGSLYAITGRGAEARVQLRKAASTNDTALRALALAALSAIP